MKKAMRTILKCMLALIALFAAQFFAILVGQLSVVAGFPKIVEPIIDAVLYPILTFLGLKLIAGKKMGFSLKPFRIGTPKIKWYWVVAAILLPAFVVCSFILLNGSWIVNDASAYDKWVVLLFGILYYSLAAGIVEEMVFRGVIMGIIEREYNFIFAILIPSILFGVVHIIGNELNPISIFQLIVAGTFVGVMFSLIEYQSGSFWNNAMVHAFWNMSTIGLCHIGFKTDENSLFTLIINTKSSIISGGDFGIESSIIAIVGYLMVILMAVCLIKKSRKNIYNEEVTEQ